jgi:hypothetical protein
LIQNRTCGYLKRERKKRYNFESGKIKTRNILREKERNRPRHGNSY